MAPRTHLTIEKVRAALIVADGSPQRAGEVLGVSRQTIHTWMRKHDIKAKRVVEGGLEGGAGEAA